MSFLAKAASVVSTKGAIGLATALLAIGAAGAAVEASATGTTDPSNWGHQVVQQVDKCKAALAPGSHGIGQCVSAFAKQHGKQVSADHRASGARGAASGARLNGSDHNPGPPANPGKPSDNPGGRPTNVPPTGS